jgi:hypothetical protein
MILARRRPLIDLGIASVVWHGAVGEVAFRGDGNWYPIHARPEDGTVVFNEGLDAFFRAARVPLSGRTRFGAELGDVAGTLMAFGAVAAVAAPLVVAFVATLETVGDIVMGTPWPQTAWPRLVRGVYAVAQQSATYITRGDLERRRWWPWFCVAVALPGGVTLVVTVVQAIRTRPTWAAAIGRIGRVLGIGVGLIAGVVLMLVLGGFDWIGAHSVAVMFAVLAWWAVRRVTRALEQRPATRDQPR